MPPQYSEYRHGFDFFLLLESYDHSCYCSLAAILIIKCLLILRSVLCPDEPQQLLHPAGQKCNHQQAFEL